MGVGAAQGFLCMSVSMSMCLCIAHAGQRSTPDSESSVPVQACLRAYLGARDALASDR